MSIVLIGFMGSGKSSVAKFLSSHLDYEVLEMDAIVCKQLGVENMQELFSQGGETLLRQMERKIAKEYRAAEKMVISTGGGVVLSEEIFDYFRKKGERVFFLKAQFETLEKRLKGDRSRPLFQEINRAKHLYNLRAPLYIKYADEIVEVDMCSTEEISFTVEKIYRNSL